MARSHGDVQRKVQVPNPRRLSTVDIPTLQSGLRDAKGLGLRVRRLINDSQCFNSAPALAQWPDFQTQPSGAARAALTKACQQSALRNVYFSYDHFVLGLVAAHDSGWKGNGNCVAH